jgi:histidyl-tRNA synthetase
VGFFEERAVSKLIEPRTLKGFRDYPPELMIPRERVLETARRVYRSYGYAPIDTPALEYAEVLLGKGGEESDRLVYRFKDHGDRDVAMRFDLTVPFARFAAEYVPRLGTPFKRYAMGPVWRGENTAAGRYREFWQCDFDTIGTTANAADIEVALVINDLFAALEIDRFEIRVNNRMVLNGLLLAFGLEEQSIPILRALDKLPKIGRDAVLTEMQQIEGMNEETAGLILNFTRISGDHQETFELLLNLSNNAPAAHDDKSKIERFKYRIETGVRNLRELLSVARSAGVPDGRIKIDLSIARGLDYYTGTIYETFLTDLPGIGSVCSGGRYDNLASLYTKQVLPGVGASLGVDRLLTAMQELKHPWMSGVSTPAEVLVVQFDAARLGDYQRVARELRATGIATEVYPEAKKVKAQFEYADKRGFRLALIAGPDEFEKGVWKVKDLAKREEVTVPAAELPDRVMCMVRG